MTTSSLYTFGNTANVSANNFTTLYNSSGQNITPSTGYGNANVQSFLAVGSDGGNTIGNIVAAGNVSASFFLGNGAFLTGLPASYSNAQVAAFLASGADSSNIITSGNITGGFIFGNGSQLTGLPATYSNANVAAYLPTYTGNLAGGNLAITKDILASGNITASLDITSGADIQAAGNIRTTGPSGNITGVNYMSAQFYVGDGGLLSNIGSPYSNANVSAYLAAGISSNIVTTGNVSGTFFLGNGSQLTGLPATYSNANVVSLLANFGSNTISTTGNIDAGNISASGNITVAGSLNSDDITSAGVTVYGDQIITGNLTVQGTTTTINSNTIVTNDKTITVANNQSTMANVNGAGLEAGNPAVATLLYNALTDSWQSNVGVTPVANLTQELGNNQHRWSTVYAGAVNASGNVSAAGNVAGEYVIANTALYFGSDTPIEAITADNLTMTLYTNGQARLVLTSGGGNLQGNLNLNNLIGNGILNSYGVVANGNILASGIISATGNITSAGNIAAGNVIGTYLWGDGSNITGVVAGAASTRFAVKNTTGGTLVKGTPVYATGTVGASTVLEIAASRADTPATMPTIGLLDSTLAINGQGYAISVGTLTTIDTSTFTTGQALYVGATGGLTAARPTGTNLVQTLGAVGRVDASNGSIETNIWNVYALPNLGNGNIWQGNATGYPTEVTPYGNANVAANLAAFGSNPVSTTGNITAGYFIGDGSLLTGLPASYSNANVTTLLASGNVTSNIITTGNVSGAFFLGNGSQLTGLPATYSNANVATFLANFGSNVISTTGNITTTGNIAANYYTGNGSLLTGVTASLPANITGTSVSVTGNVTGSYFLGNGSLLTGITASLPANVTANVFTSQVYTYGNATGTITPDISLGSIQTMTLTGNITLNSLANVNTGQSATFIMTQDATGNRLLTSTWKFASNVRTLSTAANAVDMISVTYIGNTYYASLIRGFL